MSDQNRPDAPKTLKLFRLSLNGAVELGCHLVIYGGTAIVYRVVRSGYQGRPIRTTHAFIWRVPYL
eukprot:6078658-Pleurochrysis_carterae.AAC.1